MNSSFLSGSQIITEELVSHEVGTVFGYPGGAIMPLYDALEQETSIQHVLVRHEQGAGFAASGYARTAGKAGVCIATSGPGATNLITSITDAASDGVPMVAITGQVAADLLGTGAFQEAPITEMLRPVCKRVFQAQKTEDIQEMMREAFEIAQSGRPGPVLIDVCKNAQQEQAEYTPHPKREARPAQLSQELQQALDQVSNRLLSSKKPLVMFGKGIHTSSAQESLRAFIERSGIPAAATLQGLGILGPQHPHYLGMLGMHGNIAANKATEQADCIMGIGLRFDDRVTGKAQDFAPHAEILHIDIDSRMEGKTIQPTLFVPSDAKMALDYLLALSKTHPHTGWFTEASTYQAEEAAVPSGSTLHISMKQAIEAVSRAGNSSTIYVSDVGQHQMAAARYLELGPQDRLLNSGGLGSMGFALPAGIGAYYAQPESTLCVICGDGSFQMSLQELGTILQEQIPIKILLLNNGYLGMVRQWQELFYQKNYAQVELVSPSFEGIARSYAMDYFRAESPASLEQALKEFIKNPGPALCEVLVEQEENVFPMVPAGKAAHEMILRAP